MSEKKRTLTTQLVTLKYQMACVFLPVIAGLSFLSYQKILPVSELVRDKASLMNVQPYWGLLSNIGIILWCVSAAVCFFSYFLIRKHKDNHIPVSFFLISGILSAVLLADDFFLVHDIIFPKVFMTYGDILVAIYFILIAVFMFNYRKTIIQKTDYSILVISIVFFGMSLSIDIKGLPFHTLLSTRQSIYLIEDGTKLLGIIGWCFYFTRVAFTQLKSQLLQDIDF